MADFYVGYRSRFSYNQVGPNLTVFVGTTMDQGKLDEWTKLDKGYFLMKSYALLTFGTLGSKII